MKIKKYNIKGEEKLIHAFTKFENVVSILISVILGLIILVSSIKIVIEFYYIFISDILLKNEIIYEDYQNLFGKIITLFIVFEFLQSILKVIKTNELNILTLDVVLIAAMAIGRKLIIYDYSKNIDSYHIIVLGGLLISIGIFYFLIKYEQIKKNPPPIKNL